MMRDPEPTGGRGLRLIHVAPVLVAVLVAIRASGPILDNSFLWHIRAGSLQHDVGRVITTDPFSYTVGGEPWRTQSWIAELGYAFAERTFSSLAWVNWMVFVVGLVILALIGVSVYRRNRSIVVLTLSLLVATWLLAPFAQPRPVLLSYVFIAAGVVIITEPDRLAWALVPLFWIWAGIHGSWVIGGGLVVLEVIRTRDRKLFLAGVASLIATLFTAHGIGAWEVLVTFLRNGDALGLIEEWLPPDFGAMAQAPYVIVMVGILVGLARQKLRLGDLIVIVPFLVFGMTTRRAVFPATIVLLPYAVAGLPEVRVPKSAVPRRTVAAVFVVVAILSIAPMFMNRLGVLDSDRFASAEILDSMQDRTPFHDGAIGGQLIYDRWPEILVYVDDRAELYGYGGISAFRDAMAGDYRDEFARYGIDVAVVKPESTLYRQLISDGWSVEVTSDEFVSLVPGFDG